MRTGFDSTGREPLRVSWNGYIRINLYVFISKSMGFSQQIKDSSNW